MTIFWKGAKRMANRWLSIAQVEKETGIPNRTIRRYMEQHTYLMVKKQHRKYMFSVDSLPILLKIREYYANGMNVHQVNEILSQLDVVTVLTNDQNVMSNTSNDIKIPEENKDEYDRLLESEMKFREAFQNANDAVFLSDFETNRFIEVNNVACKRLEYSREELLTMSFMNISSKERTLDELLRIRQEYVQREYTIFEASQISKSGIKIPVEVSISFYEVNGRKIILSIARDITERKKMEKALLETNQTLQALNQASPLGNVVLDIKGNVKMWNPASEQIFGWKEIEIMELGIELIIAKDKLETFHALQKITLQGKALTGVEITCKKKDDTLIDVILSIAPLINMKGEISGSIVSFASLTDLIPKKYLDSM
jgi:PAS domain S-box-containing protein